MAQQELKLVISVDAQNAAEKVHALPEKLKKLGFNLGTSTVKLQDHSERIQRTTSHYAELGRQARNTGSALQSAMSAMNTAHSFFANIGRMATSMTTVILELQAAQRLLNNSTEDGGKAFDWVKGKAYEYGITVSQLAHDYAIYRSAVKESKLTTEQQNYVFESFVQTVSALGLSVESSGRVFLALREIISKGTLQSTEDVR